MDMTAHSSLHVHPLHVRSLHDGGYSSAYLLPHARMRTLKHIHAAWREPRLGSGTSACSSKQEPPDARCTGTGARMPLWEGLQPHEGSQGFAFQLVGGKEARGTGVGAHRRALEAIWIPCMGSSSACGIWSCACTSSAKMLMRLVRWNVFGMESAALGIHYQAVIVCLGMSSWP